MGAAGSSESPGVLSARWIPGIDVDRAEFRTTAMYQFSLTFSAGKVARRDVVPVAARVRFGCGDTRSPTAPPDPDGPQEMCSKVGRGNETRIELFVEGAAQLDRHALQRLMAA